MRTVPSPFTLACVCGQEQRLTPRVSMFWVFSPVLSSDRVYISYRAKLNCPGGSALSFVYLYSFGDLLENSLELFNCVIDPAPSRGYHGIVVKAGTIR